MRLTSNEASDIAACRELLRAGSKSFHAASLLLPRAVREPATALYAFCRIADDAVDLVDAKHAALARLAHRLDRVYAGAPLPMPADRAFARVVAAHAIPRALPEALLEGLLWDAEVRRYATIADVEAYGARVAGAVGAMMSLVMGVRDPVAMARATDLGIAMQLTNIARDVGEDARAGRLYLPLAWLREADIDPDAFLRAPVFSPAIASVTHRLLLRAEDLYLRGGTGLALLPRGCRPAIGAARRIYAAIGAKVAAHGYDSVSRRAVVPRGEKLRLIGASLVAAALPSPPADRSPALEANRHLVEAIPYAWQRPQGISARIGWMMDIFARIEQPRA
ncbi:phytoene/squalene synthase family protein [Roseomonas arctica]|uniref:Phytoene/squalene synthase family protein n=2 Tax=Plastoroseomonas arctica TaxID=1509237 RepID=A0AAF1JVD3_9PROT|nr:phytoene/squalene synthase family protein [Plastoroseomonas arctica]